MPTGTGLDAQIGWVREVTYGTPLTPTQFFEFNSEGFEKDKVTVQGTGLRAGGKFARAARRVVTTRGGKGSLTGDFVTNGMGELLKQITGTSTNTVRAGAPTVYDQVHTPGALRGLSLTVQKGMPPTTGSVEPFTYPGCKLTDLDISVSKGGLAVCTATFDAQDERTLGTTPASAALATAAYSSTAAPLSFLSSVLTIGGSDPGGVTKANVKLTRPMKTDRYYLGAGGLKAEPLENGLGTVTGTIEADFVTRAALYDAFVNDTAVALVLTFTGPNIGATGIPSLLRITVPSIRFDGATPKAGGPDVLGMSIPYVGLDDAVNPVVKYEYTTSDTTY